MVQTLTVQLVSNYYVPESMRQVAVDAVLGRIRGEVPDGVEVDVLLESTLEVLCRVIRMENESGQGKRYGHPVLDLVRELNRYMHPDIKYAGNDRQAVQEIKGALVEMLLAALQGS